MNVAVGTKISTVADGIKAGWLVGEEGNVGTTVGCGVAVEQAVMKVKRIGMIFFMIIFKATYASPTRLWR